MYQYLLYQIDMKFHTPTNLVYKLISIVLIKVKNKNHIIYSLHTLYDNSFKFIV